MGLLITVEGGEFTGKTSVVIPGLEEIFEKSGFEVLTSREPGGTPKGEEIRQTIFRRLKQGASPEELAILFNQGRKIHLDEIIIPFLGPDRNLTDQDGRQRIVLLDRYLDSTRVYQGLEAGVNQEKIRELENEYVGDWYPDETLILYFPEEKFNAAFMSRKQIAEQEINNRDKTLWDEGELSKHLLRQRYYLSLPELSKQWGEQRAFHLIDASGTPSEVLQLANQACKKHLTITEKV